MSRPSRVFSIGRSVPVVSVLARLLLGGWMVTLAGCGQVTKPELDVEYGRATGQSINGTASLRKLFERAGAQVRIAARMHPRVLDAADVLVRFQAKPGAIDAAEWNAYQEFLTERPGRRVIYVPCAFNAEAEYWGAVEGELDEAERAARGSLLKGLRQRAEALPLKQDVQMDPGRHARPHFELRVVQDEDDPYWIFAGPWAEDLDLTGMRLPREVVLKLVDAATDWDVLLRCRGEPIVAVSFYANDSMLMLVPNGSFLLNEPLVHAERRRLAQRVVEWAVFDGGKRVVFLEGKEPASAEPPEDTLGGMGFLLRDPFRWIAAQFLAVGLVYILFHTARLGRARPLPPDEAEKPVRHAEALGDLLARSPDRRAMLVELETYRRRGGKPPPGGSPGASTTE